MSERTRKILRTLWDAMATGGGSLLVAEDPKPAAREPTQGRDVYVVSSVNHGEQEGVVAAFDTRELAEHFADYASKPPGSRYYVETWRLRGEGRDV